MAHLVRAIMSRGPGPTPGKEKEPVGASVHYYNDETVLCARWRTRGA